MQNIFPSYGLCLQELQIKGPSKLTQTIEQGRVHSVHAQTMSAPPRSSRLLRQFKAFSTCAHVRTADFQPFPTHLTSLLQYLLPATSLSLLFWSHCLDEPSKTIWLWHFTSQLPRCAELSHSGNRSCRPSLSQGISSADRPGLPGGSLCSFEAKYQVAGHFSSAGRERRPFFPLAGLPNGHRPSSSGPGQS